MSPFKPTRDDATRVTRQRDMAGEALSPDRGTEALGKGREERGGAEGNRRNPPHLTRNAGGAPLQDEVQSPGEVEPLPANASGREEVSAEESAQPIDPESMYDRRPDEDKDRPPSTRAR